MSYELPDLKTLGVVVGTFAVSTLAFFRIAGNQTQLITSAHPNALPNDDIDAICEAMRRYREYKLETFEKRKEIWQILYRQNSELSAYSDQIATEYAKLENSRVTIKGVTHFQQTGISNSKAKCTGYAELLSLYRELVKMYPMAEFESWDTVEERRNITVRMVEEAHSAFEEHHMKVLGVAEELLTESGITVQRAINIIKKIEDRDKQATSIRVSYV